MYSKVIQLYIYIHSFFFRLFTHIGYYRIWCRVPCAIQKVHSYVESSYKNDTNELIYKTNRLTDFENKFMVAKGETWGGA